MSNFRLIPRSKGGNKGIYFGRIEEYDGGSWAPVTGENQVLFEWRNPKKAPNTVTAAANILSVSTLTPTTNPPDILSFSADDVEILQLGSMVPFAIFSETGQLLDMPGTSISADLVEIDLSNVVGQVKLYVASWQTRTISVTPSELVVQLHGTVRPCGAIMSDGSIVRNWSYVLYANSNTQLVFGTVPSGMSASSNLLVVPELITQSAKNRQFSTNIVVKGEYPIRTLNRDGTVWSDNAIVRNGNTLVEVQKNIPVVTVMVPRWMSPRDSNAGFDNPPVDDEIDLSNLGSLATLDFINTENIRNKAVTIEKLSDAIVALLNDIPDNLTNRVVWITNRITVTCDGSENKTLDASSSHQWTLDVTGDTDVMISNLTNWHNQVSIAVINPGSYAVNFPGVDYKGGEKPATGRYELTVSKIGAEKWAEFGNELTTGA